jgi:dipeptidyl-peptidase-4
MATVSLPAQLARTRRFTRGLPERFTIALDGTAVIFGAAARGTIR